MLLPATQNLPALYRNSDYVVQIKFIDAENTPIDLTDYQGIYSSIWTTTAPNSKLVDFTVTVINPTQGHIQLSLTEEQTTRFNKSIVSSYYDVLVKEPNGDQYYWLKGSIPIKQGYSVPSS
jgi:hypothetical protein